MKTERIDTAVIGGGQAGLAAGYYLAQQKRDFVILDTHGRAGDSWRKRWDSLRLFTPTGFNHLPGLPFPKSRSRFPTKDQMANYLESYVAHFQFPILLNTKVNQLVRDDDHYLTTADTLRLKANRVIVATGAYPTPRVPAFANQLDPGIVQLHSAAYHDPGQLHDGAVLVVGAGNSGVEIALELASRYPVWLAGRDTGFIPFNLGKFSYEFGAIIFKALMQRLTVDTLPGRWIVQRAREFAGGHPVIGITSEDLVQAGIQRVPRVTGVSHGRPVLENGLVLDVANVIWATGFVRDYRWIRLPAFDSNGNPIHHRGVVQNEPGLYFVGLPFQSSLLSGLVAGAGADARYITKQINVRAKVTDLARGGKADRSNKQRIRSLKMIEKQVKQIVKKITVNDYIMENMFCAPKGALGRLGGQLMSQDRWLPAWVLDFLEIHPTDSVLEVGPGPGLGLRLAAARAHQGRVAGVDPSKTMLEMAYRRNHALIEAGRIELHLGSADKLPFGDATFDKAMTINSHHLWPDTIAGLKEIRRALRAGGHMAMAITRFSYASPDNFESLLIDAGFNNVSLHTGESGTCALGRA